MRCASYLTLYFVHLHSSNILKKGQTCMADWSPGAGVQSVRNCTSILYLILTCKPSPKSKTHGTWSPEAITPGASQHPCQLQQGRAPEHALPPSVASVSASSLGRNAPSASIVLVANDTPSMRTDCASLCCGIACFLCPFCSIFSSLFFFPFLNPPLAPLITAAPLPSRGVLSHWLFQTLVGPARRAAMQTCGPDADMQCERAKKEKDVDGTLHGRCSARLLVSCVAANLQTR